jgi:hypothetical protein
LNPAPPAGSLVSLAGILVLARQYLHGRREAFKLLFAAQLAVMFDGQALEFWSSVAGWSVALYKLYYFSSPLSAGVLAWL